MTQPNQIGSPEQHASGCCAFVRWSAVVARLLMGLAFVVFGLNKLLNFIQLPPFPEQAAAFFQSLYATGYMIPLIAGTEITAGVLLFVGRFVPLALVLIAPVIVNMVCFHAFLDPAAGVPAYVIAALELYLIWCYRRAYAPLFTPRAMPGGG